MGKQVFLKGPYNFYQALKRLTIDPLVDLNVEKQAIKLPIIVENNPLVVHVIQQGTFEEPRFMIQTEDTVNEAALMAELNRIFHWDKPLEDIYTFFQATELAALFQELRGTPFVCDFTLYGCLMKTIIHQQLNMTFAYELTKRFITTYGFKKKGVWFYPTADRVASLSVAELRELQFSQRKAEYVIDTSKLIAEGNLNLEALKNFSDEEVMDKLVRIRGIGRWTAECFLMFGLGRLDLFPVQDIGIQNGIKKYYQLDKKPEKEKMLEMSSHWKPYRTYASLYLWDYLET
ncbi:DNA-3-methyladenine glycosylase family protein [Evansella cellulosilytica]|uniref:DNA-3-methyladenine glycosylase II n=1 Tax=Evansella cellulosilytica (strain ATCC 21833 / DSM 2522 / FERM P-1141 / JCM 9156 / N-4) TaxID=649639 RepID=E6U0P5_EVAC2|nr:DNA-3-methyladenine glycosylase [Evansella cellulosilytica]ADU29093.1 HhH-GPD family protein [Evansella cellulosilytica DSM 2522]